MSKHSNHEKAVKSHLGAAAQQNYVEGLIHKTLGRISCDKYACVQGKRTDCEALYFEKDRQNC